MLKTSSRSRFEIDDLASGQTRTHHRFQSDARSIGFKVQLIAFDLARVAGQGDWFLARQPEGSPPAARWSLSQIQPEGFRLELWRSPCARPRRLWRQGDRGEADIAGQVFLCAQRVRRERKGRKRSRRVIHRQSAWHICVIRTA